MRLSNGRLCFPTVSCLSSAVAVGTSGTGSARADRLGPPATSHHAVLSSVEQCRAVGRNAADLPTELLLDVHLSAYLTDGLPT